MRHVLAALVLVVSSAVAVAAEPVIFLVRHAERADTGMASAKMAGADPDLSAAGMARAKALAAMLKDARITAVVTTEYKRTRQTGEPAASAAGLSLTVIESKNTAAAIEKLKSAQGNVLIVGHSNTVPELLKGLGVTEPVTIAEDEFDALFVVTRGAPPTLVRLRY
jgi:2,3-bisphosphoglycerate-dependent phosphoglycerate mutase